MEEANEAIRRFVAEVTVWGPAELEELARLRRAWMAAVAQPLGQGDVVTAA